MNKRKVAILDSNQKEEIEESLSWSLRGPLYLEHVSNKIMAPAV
jgi:hypothetical protein